MIRVQIFDGFTQQIFGDRFKAKNTHREPSCHSATLQSLWGAEKIKCELFLLSLTAVNSNSNSGRNAINPAKEIGVPPRAGSSRVFS